MNDGAGFPPLAADRLLRPTQPSLAETWHVLEEVNRDLERFGNRLVTQIRPLGWECELNPPVFRQYNAWGQRVDQIVTCSAWRRMKEIAAEEGLIAEAYERRYSNWSGLSLFFLKVRDEEGKLNSIQVQRLKDKLGTRQMATAELWLDGAKAELISAEGRGVASISNMLNITRIHNVIGAVASMRRMISLSREYARKRVAFGKLLKDHPLHMQTIARMEASAVAVEAMESFGGQGYMEDTGLPVILRDTLVLSIWEGTTNILSLDVLRSLTKSQGQAMAVFFSTVQKKLELASSSAKLEPAVKQMRDAISSLARFTQAAGAKGALTMELAARDFSYSLARVYTGRGKDRNDGFQTKKGLGISPRMVSHLRGKGWSFKESLVPTFIAS
ncbi:acyl- dehydrogenase family member 11 isoform x1 [Limosa lapponica baueri]|uniref:Acyl-dehydrogenase family member 11 isoform x1 n=1 Tax=Limosa lapponica baueri TaxID=1758121 RepID=A0A2I0TB45_LIMLA|nr:acyl- dehydrogenase family member 11 isoform x1 [Limosa lapponica baueri]